jgi:hypothetical protein
LNDELYNDNLKEIIKVGTIPTKNIIQKAYDMYKNSIDHYNTNEGM